MDGWWTQIEDEILSCLADEAALTPGELAHRLGLPESATVSLVAMMLSEGKVSVSGVAAARPGNCGAARG